MRAINKIIPGGNTTLAAELRHVYIGKPASSILLTTSYIVKGEKVTQFLTVVY